MIRRSLCDHFALDLAVFSMIQLIQNSIRMIRTTDIKLLKSLLIITGLVLTSNRLIEAIKNVSFSNKKSSGNLKDPLLLVLQDARSVWMLSVQLALRGPSIMVVSEIMQFIFLIMSLLLLSDIFTINCFYLKI